MAVEMLYKCIAGGTSTSMIEDAAAAAAAEENRKDAADDDVGDLMELDTDSSSSSSSEADDFSEVSSASTSSITRVHKASKNGRDRHRRRVHFVCRENQVFVYPNGDRKNNKGELWYTCEEISDMKQRAKISCRKRRDLEHALDEVYSMESLPTAAAVLAAADDVNGCGDDPGSSNGDSDMIDMAHLESAARKLLDIPYFEEQRGFERYSSKRYSLSRGLTLVQVKSEVLSRRLDQSAEPSSSAASMGAACAFASVPAVRFAQILGYLDACIAAVDR